MIYEYSLKETLQTEMNNTHYKVVFCFVFVSVDWFFCYFFFLPYLIEFTNSENTAMNMVLTKESN